MKKRGMEKMSGVGKASKTAHSHRLREILAVLYRHEVIKGVTPKKLRLILQDLGPTFVKIGQILSMRGDLLPESFIRELSLLRDSVRPMSFSKVWEILSEEYEKAPEAIFTSFDKEPIGAASMAQVHMAELIQGKKVVVKVQRVGIDEQMCKDMALLHKAAGLLQLTGVTGGAIDFRNVLDEMWFVAQQEMDFEVEAQNIETFAVDQKDTAYVACPIVYHEYTSKRVLVMEYVDGIPINQKEQLLAQGYNLREVAEKLCVNFTKQILENGFFHADPHPGNLSIRDGKIVYLDFGMVGRLTPREQQLIKRVVKGVVFSDVQDVKAALLSLAVHRQPIDHARLYEDIESIMNRYSSMAMGQMNIGKMIEEVLTVSNRHSLQMPEGMTMLSRGMITVQGVVSQLCPEVDFVSAMAANAKSDLLGDTDWVHEVTQGARNLLRSSKKALELPHQLSDFLQTAIRGQGKINLELTGSEKPLQYISRMVNRLIIGFLCSALLISSALICQASITPLWFGIPWAAFLGFLSASVLVAILMRMIWRGRKG